MQAVKLRAVFKLAAVNKNFIRTAAVNTSTVTENVETTQNVKSWKEIPGPFSLPFIGPLLSVLPGGALAGYKGVLLSERVYELYGPLVRFEGFLGAPNMIFLFDANAIEYVLRSENTMPIRPGFASLEYYRQRHNKVYDPKRQTGLISDHGENWRDFRKKVNHIMLQPKTIKLYTDVLEKVSDDMVASLTKFFIDHASKNMEDSKKNLAEVSNTEKPILEKLLEIDVRVAHVMASDMLMAGVDTAANTALATFYLLATNPEKQNKLREEILTKTPQKPYLKACIKESMRMLPVVNGNMRLTTKEYNLLGYRIPKDVMVVFSHQYMSNMQEHYPRPDEYIPERWLTDKDDPLYHGNAHPFVMSPFGYGVRMCIGRRIAELEMQTFISKVIENFRIDWKGEPIQITATSLNYVTGPFNFIFKDL